MCANKWLILNRHICVRSEYLKPFNCAKIELLVLEPFHCVQINKYYWIELFVLNSCTCYHFTRVEVTAQWCSFVWHTVEKWLCFPQVLHVWSHAEHVKWRALVPGVPYWWLLQPMQTWQGSAMLLLWVAVALVSIWPLLVCAALFFLVCNTLTSRLKLCLRYQSCHGLCIEWGEWEGRCKSHFSNMQNKQQ